LETIGHVLLYFLRGGHLPWMNASGANKEEKRHNMRQIMQSTPLEELCKNQPSQFLDYMMYCRRLTFTEKPDYTYLLNLFNTCLENLVTKTEEEKTQEATLDDINPEISPIKKSDQSSPIMVKKGAEVNLMIKKRSSKRSTKQEVDI
jgi:hypothetical protein